MGKYISTREIEDLYHKLVDNKEMITKMLTKKEIKILDRCMRFMMYRLPQIAGSTRVVANDLTHI